MEKSRQYSLLALAGAVPFVVCALLPQIGIDALPLIGAVEPFANTYGLAIVCFLAGIHWATQLYLQDSAPGNLFIASNIVFLIALFAYVIAPIDVSLTVILLFLLASLGIDFVIHRAQLISEWYLRIRALATTVASLSLIVLILT